jgi:small multidrug resistance pump
MNLSFILWLAASMAIFLGGATASRYYVSTNNILILLFSLGLYCLGNLMMVRLMREGGLGLAISASAIAQLLLVNFIAFAVFGERMTLPQLAGVASVSYRWG